MAENTRSASFEAAQNRVRSMNDAAMRYSALGNSLYGGNTAPAESTKPPKDLPQPKSDPIQGIMRNFGLDSVFADMDSERFLLMVLIVLLVSEGKNYILAAALIYVLM